MSVTAGAGSCGISIDLSFRSVTGGVRPCLLATKHFYSFVSQVRCCWRPPFSVGHVAFLFICLPGLSLLLSALFRTQCSISIHSFPRSVTVGVRPFSPAMQHFYSFASQVCHCWCPPFSASHAAFLFICFPGLSLALPPFSAGHVAFLFICLACDFFLFVFQAWCISIHLFPGSVTGAAALFRWPCSISIHLSRM